MGVMKQLEELQKQSEDTQRCKGREATDIAFRCSLSAGESGTILSGVLLGRLLGKQGGTIKELQRLTDCGVTVRDSCDSQGRRIVDISGKSKAQEDRCVRAAHLVLDGGYLRGAVKQANLEYQQATSKDDETSQYL